MAEKHRLKVTLLVVGDIVALYVTLVLTLAIRYGDNFYSELIDSHLAPFSIIFTLWMVVFYIAGLYDLRRLRNNIEFLKMLLGSLIVNAALAITFFYLVPSFDITPKRNLFIFLALFFVVEGWWRHFFNRRTEHIQPSTSVVIVGESPAAEEAIQFLKEHPQLGYVIAKRDTRLSGKDPYWDTFATPNSSCLLVVPRRMKREARFTKVLYNLLSRGLVVIDVPTFYETLMRKIPLSDIDEAWFIETFTERHAIYDDLKRAAEFVASLLILIVLSPLLLLAALLVKLTSRGPILYCQTRTGKHGELFTLYKFRSMYHTKDKNPDADGSKPIWSPGNDKRATPVGKFLRRSHLDELPQLLNILSGKLSFVGPRPERPEFIAELKKNIPHYNIRHLVKPGITGWAQIQYRHEASVEDTREKLQYDLYYLKHRSFVLDLAIIMKTVKALFVSSE